MNSDLTEIKQLPIREVATRLGIRVLGKSKAMCFGGHDRNTPSLSFDLRRNIWKCFGCGKNGDTLALVMEVLQIDFKHALDWIAGEFRVNLPRSSIRRNVQSARRMGTTSRLTSDNSVSKANIDIPKFYPDPELYSWLVERCGEVFQSTGLNYLREHGISPGIAKKFRLREIRFPGRALEQLIERWGTDRVFRSGLAWGDHGIPERLIWTSYAILFPFFSGKTVHFLQGRLFSGKQKYINPRGVPKPLFNADPLSSLPHGSLVHICEGIPDVLAFESNRIFAVGVLGASSFRPDWVDLFNRYSVVVVPDGDSGGEIFFRHVSDAFEARGRTVRRVRVPNGKDAADVIAEIGRAQ